jgi:hypothetical protein
MLSGYVLECCQKRSNWIKEKVLRGLEAQNTEPILLPWLSVVTSLFDMEV